jgi:restriction endonuclease
MEFNLDTTIKELHEQGIISVRTYNSLHYAGMDTLGEILDNIETPMDLLNIRNVVESVTVYGKIPTKSLQIPTIANSSYTRLHVCSAS